MYLSANLYPLSLPHMQPHIILARLATFIDHLIV